MLRVESFERIACEPLDVLVIGGGIVGAGIARDAAMRGLRVALVEQHDFAYGTSSRSSRLLHGGLRYLAQGRIGLVREASLEKRVIHRIAPHLAQPLPFIFPTYKCRPWDQWAHWKLRIGVRIYDLLCNGRNFGRSRSLSAEEVSELLPLVRREGLVGAVRYYDGLTSDARLVLDTLRSASTAGAFVLNYCRLTGAAPQGPLWRCSLQDVLRGTEHTARARCVVNAAGPWGDLLEHSAVRLRLTKGVHLVIERERLDVPDAVVITEGNRILFVIPWGERIILGTTDTDYDGPIEAVSTEPEDIDYILTTINRAFPRAQLSPADVISAWAGLRPLLSDPDGHPSDISRAHEIRSPKPGWWDVAGGKLTTYRLMGEQTVDQLQQYIGGARTECRTAVEPLLDAGEVASVSGIVPPEVSRGAVEHYCKSEWAIHLEDVMVRRTSWHYYLRNARQIAPQVADWMGGALGWSEQRRDEELARYLGERVSKSSEARMLKSTPC